MDEAKLNVFKRDLQELYKQSLELTGLPLDVLMVMIFRSASNKGLAANGVMINLGGNGAFVPDDNTLALWTDAYFTTVQQASAAENQQQTNLETPQS